MQLTETPPPAGFAELASLRPELENLWSRPLYTPPSKTQLEDKALQVGRAASDLDALFSQSFVDLAALRANVDRALRNREQITLAGVLQSAPSREGLAEVIGYLHLASRDPRLKVNVQREITYSLIMGLIGGIMPAIHAARLPIPKAVREL